MKIKFAQNIKGIAGQKSKATLHVDNKNVPSDMDFLLDDLNNLVLIKVINSEMDLIAADRNVEIKISAGREYEFSKPI